MAVFVVVVQADITHRAARRQHLQHIFVIVVTGGFQQLRGFENADADDGDIHFIKARHHVSDIFAGQQPVALLHGSLDAL